MSFLKSSHQDTPVYTRILHQTPRNTGICLDIQEFSIKHQYPETCSRIHYQTPTLRIQHHYLPSNTNNFKHQCQNVSTSIQTPAFLTKHEPSPTHSNTLIFHQTPSSTIKSKIHKTKFFLLNTNF